MTLGKKSVVALVAVLAVVACIAFAAKVAPASVKNDETRFLNEMKQKVDWASPTIEDKSVKVTGLPEQVTWYTAKAPIMGSKAAKQGGTYPLYIQEFPQTFRTVGPNANGGFRSYLGQNLGLVDINPETKEWIPSAATHWAFGKDGKTVYFLLDKRVKWSDGKPCTADDYTFILEFMRSTNINDPWYNEYYTEELVDIKKYNDYLISVHVDVEMNKDDLLYNAIVSPRPRHFYPSGVPADYVESYNWKAEPTTGPYYLADYKKGEYVNFKKVAKWWGNELPINKYRFNVETINIKVITGGNDVLREYFYKGELYNFYLIIPSEWADSAGKQNIANGYIDRYYSFYVPSQGMMGIFFNTKAPIFSDKNVRYGMYYAVNMQKMIDTVLRGEYSRFHNTGIGHVFAGINFDDDTLRVPNFDPKKAGEYFDKAGYSTIGSDGIRVNAKGERLAFELLYQSPNHTERLTVLKEEAKLSGVEINLKLMQSGMFTVVREKKHQAAWFTMSTSLYPDYWEYLHSSNADKPQTNNFFGWSSPETDQLVDAFRSEGDLKKKAEITKKIQRIIFDNALIVPGYYVPYNRGAAWKWVRFPGWLNAKYQDDYFDPIANGYMWIDPAIEKDVKAAMAKGDTLDARTFTVTTYKAK